MVDGDACHHGRRTAPHGLAYRAGNRRIWRQVDGVHDGRAQRRRQADRGRVEGVVVHNVVSAFAYLLVDTSEGPLGNGRAGDGLARRPVKRGRQVAVIDSRVDDLDAPYRRSGGGVQVNVVAPPDQPARELGYEGLRATPLGLSDRADERSNDRQLHPAITLKATSRGGLTPNVSNDTRRRAPRRTSAAAPG